MPPSASTLLNRFTVKAKFRHLQVLVKLAELGSMRRTAQAVHMSQPAISLLVSELEKMLETELFFRHARGVEPTEATRELLPVAQRILAALGEGAESVANRLHEQGGVVRVSASPAAIGGMLQVTLDEFARKHPDVQVHISQTNDVDPLGGVAEETADIVCIREPAIIPEGWLFERCLDDELVAVCGANHPFARQKNLSINDLGQAKWLQSRVGSVARDRFEEVSNDGGWPLSSRCQIIMHIPELTREMLLTGHYMALLPKSVAMPWLETGVIIELNTEMNTSLAPLGFLWRKTHAGPATTKFATHLRRAR
jgi:DNA-binding transcriptional LysR family regulator